MKNYKNIGTVGRVVRVVAGGIPRRAQPTRQARRPHPGSALLGMAQLDEVTQIGGVALTLQCPKHTADDVELIERLLEDADEAALRPDRGPPMDSPQPMVPALGGLGLVRSELREHPIPDRLGLRLPGVGLFARLVHALLPMVGAADCSPRDCV